MSDPMQASSGLEERGDSPIPNAFERVRAWINPCSLPFWERLGTGMLFLLLLFLIVVQSIAVVSHWFGKQAIEQMAIVAVFVLGAFTAIGLSYLVIKGLRRCLQAPASPDSNVPAKDVDGPSRLFRASKELMKLLFFSCIVVFARPGNPTFLLIVVLATVLYLLWQRWISPDWGTAIGETFVIFVLGMALRLWKDSLQPPVPVKQGPIPAVRLETIRSSNAVFCNRSTPFKKQIHTVTPSGERHEPVLFAIQVLFDADTADLALRFCSLCPDGDRGSGDRFRECHGRFG